MAERIESIWDRVGRGDGSVAASERVVRDVIRDFNKSHDEMLHLESSRRYNLGNWYRERKSEMSTLGSPPFRNMSDSMLIDRLSSPSTIIEEMIGLRSPLVLMPLR